MANAAGPVKNRCANAAPPNTRCAVAHYGQLADFNQELQMYVTVRRYQNAGALADARR